MAFGFVICCRSDFLDGESVRDYRVTKTPRRKKTAARDLAPAAGFLMSDSAYRVEDVAL